MSSGVLSGFTLTNGCTQTSGDSLYDQSGGGALLNSGGIVSNCLLTGCSAEHFGGGACCYEGGTLNNCTLSGNSANDGGGVSCVGRGTLNNCLLYGNTASYDGGGAYCDEGGTLNNCTISANSAYDGGGEAGGVSSGSSSGTLNNCIVFGNNDNGNSDINESGLTIRYTCSPGLSGSGCITNNPLFVNAAAGNYQLSAGSPCINAGNIAYAKGATDLDGNPRIRGGTVDMGAYEYQPTPPGNCLQFNGTNSYVDLGTNSALALTNGAFTLEAWIKPILQSNICAIIGRKNGGAANPGYAFYINTYETTNGALRFESQGVAKATAAQAIQWGVWQHVAATWDGANFLFYINGVSQAVSGSVNLTNGGVDTILGAFPGGGSYYQGQMDEVRVWSIARSASAIQDGMHHVFTGSEPGLLAYYQFDQSSGTNLPDCSTNGNNGMLVDNPVWTNSTFPCANVIASFNNIRGAWIDQTNSLGSTILSVSNAAVSGANFRVFGNDGGPLTQNTSDMPPNFAWRLDRTWQMEGAGAVIGSVVIDCTSLSNLIGNNILYLLAATNSTIANATAIPGTYADNVFRVSGQSLQSGSYYTLGESNGVAIFTNKPGITAFNITNASSVVIRGTNGEADAAYYLLSSTNVALPMNQWRTVATNILGGNGAFTFIGTNAVTPGNSCQFYRLSNTNYNP
jgi:hypothetical protein